MAKTVTQIYNELLNEKTNHADLNGLNSTSTTAIWRLWLYLTAIAHKLLYDMWDKTKEEINQIGAQQIVGTKPWYEGLALNWTGGSIGVIAASCIEILTTLDKKVILRVAGDNGSGGYTNLSTPDRTALQTYINSKKVVGTDVDIISSTADLLWFGFSIKYTGVLATVQADVEQAIKDYISNLPFGATLSMSQLSNALFSVQNVLDVTHDYTKLDNGLGYTTITTNLISSTVGYFEIGKDNFNNDHIDLNMYT